MPTTRSVPAGRPTAWVICEPLTGAKRGLALTHITVPGGAGYKLLACTSLPRPNASKSRSQRAVNRQLCVGETAQYQPGRTAAELAAALKLADQKLRVVLSTSRHQLVNTGMINTRF